MFAPTAPTCKPLVAQLAAEVVALRLPSCHHPGLDRFFQGATWPWAGIFAVSAVGLAVLIVIESVQVFFLLTTVVTIGGVVAGTLLSALWFIRMLRRSGLIGLLAGVPSGRPLGTREQAPRRPPRCGNSSAGRPIRFYERLALVLSLARWFGAVLGAVQEHRGDEGGGFLDARLVLGGHAGGGLE